jgi:predicted DNA binding CopG/RHH family protein
MKYIAIPITFILLVNITESVFSQENLFGIGGLFGLNTASLTNETNDFIGLNTGIFCNANVNDHYNLKMEILYSQNGEYILPKYYPNIDYGKIRLNHIEIPFHFDFYINSFKSTSFFPDWTLELGGAYTKLLSYYAEDKNRNEVTDQIVYDYSDAILIQIGTTGYISKHFGVNLRFSKPLSKKLDITSALRLVYRL